MQLNATKSFSAWGTEDEVDQSLSSLSEVAISLPQLTVGGKKMNLDEVTKIAFYRATVTLDPVALQLIRDKAATSSASSAPMLEMPATSTSPAASVLPREACRAAVFQLIIIWMQGRSGVRTSAVEFLTEMLNADRVPTFSSLVNAPLELVTGSAFAFSETERRAILQGEFAFTGMAVFVGGYAQKTFRTLDVIASMSCEAACVALGDSADPAVFELLRPQRGQMSSASNLKLMLDSSRNASVVQVVNAAVFKAIPQIHGPAYETSAASSRTLEIELNGSEFDSSRSTAQAFMAVQALLGATQVVTDSSLSRIAAITSTSFSADIPAQYSPPATSDAETSLILASFMGIKRLIAILGLELFTSSGVIKVADPATAAGGSGADAGDDEEALEKAREVMREKGMTEAQIAKADKKRKEKADKAAAKADGKKTKKNSSDKNTCLGLGSMKLRDLIVSEKLHEDLAKCQAAMDAYGTALSESLADFCDNLLMSLDSSSGKRKPKIPKGARDFLPEQMRIREQAFAAIRRVFKRHGAVEIDTPVFELKEVLTGKYGEDSKLIYDLADQGGELLSLRYDLTVPFARFLAMNSVGNIKRYHMAKVYRRDNPQISKGRYREFYQCDFDVAGNFPPMVADAEVITVAYEILSELPIGGFMVKLNHRGILDAIFEICGVPADKFRPICSAVDKLDKASWEEVKAEMVDEKGLDPAAADMIGKFVVFQGEPRKLWKEMMDKNVFGDHAGALAAMASMKTLFDYLEAMGSISCISFDMSLARGLDYYTGVIYEAVLTDGTSGLGSIAAGGRYDNLVGMFSVSNSQTPCVGVSVGIERVFRIMEEKSQASNALQQQSSIDVYIASIGSGLLVERMKLARVLWTHNISAEYSHLENPKFKRQLDHALGSNIPVMVVIGESELENGTVKVKDMRNHTEVEVKLEDVVAAVMAAGAKEINAGANLDLLDALR